ncbi:hypothetical protein GW17_00025196 [Ensete ventricosum]|nr:hypothetical protein GW17_00025196 [Ensete ventricosum]
MVCIVHTARYGARTGIDNISIHRYGSLLKEFPYLVGLIPREAIGKILARGHSRVPVYSGNPKNIVGLLLVGFSLLVSPLALCCFYLFFPSTILLIVNGDRPTLQQNDAAASIVARLTEDVEDGEVIGIITLEDVFEELLQEEIVDETDEYVDVHKRYALVLFCWIRVAAVAAATSSVARAPSLRRLTGQKAAGTQTRQGQQATGILKKHTEADSNTLRNQVKQEAK